MELNIGTAAEPCFIETDELISHRVEVTIGGQTIASMTVLDLFLRSAILRKTETRFDFTAESKLIG